MKLISTVALVLVSCAQALQEGSALKTSSSKEFTLSNFQTNFFWKRPGEGFYEVNVGLPTEDVRLMAMADLDNDKLTDLVTTNKAGQEVTVRYFSPATNKYSRTTSFTPASSGQIVSSILVTKSITQLQGLIAVVQEDKKNGQTFLKQYTQVSTQTPSDLQASGSQKRESIWPGKMNAKKALQDSQPTNDFQLETDSDLANLSIQSGSQPMLLDIDGDGYMDVLYQGSNGVIQVALGSSVPTIFTNVDFFNTYLDPRCQKPASLTDTISQPNSNAFVDFDGDCRQDLMMTRTDGSNNIYYEIFIQTTIDNQPRYCLTTKSEFGLGLSSTAKIIDIVDFNRDGMMDLVYPRIKTGSRSAADVVVLLNRLPARDLKAKSLCNSQPTTDQPVYSSEPALQASQTSDYYVLAKVDLPSNNAGVANSYGDWVPGRLRIADFEMDGFPDIVVSLSSSGSGKGSKTVALANQLQDNAGSATRRALNVSPEFAIAIEETAGSDTNFVTFLDLDEDGRLDFLFQKTDPSTGQPYVTALYNNIYLDNFYLKALMVNSQQTKSDNIYGNAVVGPSYRFVITDLDDRQHVVLGSQGYQQAYMALQMPYAFMGIGRSNNYVELFYAATSVSSSLGSQMWTPIIPNSQLIVFAGGSQVTESYLSVKDGTVKTEIINTKNWALELFMSPTQSLFLIVVACAACLFILAIAILILHCQEKADDAKKREQHFDYF